MKRLVDVAFCLASRIARRPSCLRLVEYRWESGDEQRDAAQKSYRTFGSVAEHFSQVFWMSVCGFGFGFGGERVILRVLLVEEREMKRKRNKRV